MKLHIPNHHAPFANAFGYSRWANAMRTALAALRALSDDIDDADALLHITPPHFFCPRNGAFNILFTAFEGEVLPDEYRTACSRADLILVPSLYNVDVFDSAAIPAKRCPLGVDSEIFRFVERKPPCRSQRFRFLWVGAPNPRKGWPILDRSWQLEFARDPHVELYVKTTSSDASRRQVGNVIADGRVLDDTQLAELYASAHCFVFPSYGEGFGLTLAEAMATGLPAIFTDYGGVRDFAHGANAYPLTPKLIAVEYFGRNLMAAANPSELAAAMRNVQHNYVLALARGRGAASDLARGFAWSKSATRLLDIVGSHLAQPSAA